MVSNRGGTLAKFIGDAVMAVFGLTCTWSDDVERALALPKPEILGDRMFPRRLEEAAASYEAST